MIPPVDILTTILFSDVTSRARAFGVIAGMGGVGAVAGPLIGGVIATAISWRAAFVFQAAIVAMIIFLSRSIVDPVAPDPTRPFDLLGAVLSVAGRLRRHDRRDRCPARDGSGLAQSLGVRARTSLDRPGDRSDADPSVNVVQSDFPEQLQGEISGLSRCVSNLGSSLGAAVAGTILVSSIGDKSYAAAMIVLACIGIVGLVATIFLPAQRVSASRRARLREAIFGRSRPRLPVPGIRPS